MMTRILRIVLGAGFALAAAFIALQLFTFRLGIRD
jgi:hypothetical protein